MNRNLLKYHMAESEKNTQEVAQALGITKRSFENRMNGTNQFKAVEIQKLIGLLNLSADETVRIFFT